MGTEMETSGNRTALGVTSDIAQQVGARLRRARESIGRSTSALSAKIKVREHYLVAIEDGQWNELPPGLNGRGLVRIYARELAVSVPELDQAANQTVMPAEQDAQAPYQIGGSKKEGMAEREIPVVRVSLEHSGISAVPARTSEQPVRTSTLNSSTRNVRPAEVHHTHARVVPVQPATPHRIIESTPEEEPLDVVTPDVASILGITLDTMDERPQPQSIRPMSAAPAPVVAMPERAAPTPANNATSVSDVPVMVLASEEMSVSNNTTVAVLNTASQPEVQVLAEPAAPATSEQNLTAVVEVKDQPVGSDVEHAKTGHHSHKKNKKNNRGKFGREEKQSTQAESNKFSDTQNLISEVDVKVESSVVESFVAENSVAVATRSKDELVESGKETSLQGHESTSIQAHESEAVQAAQSQASVGVSAAEQYLKNQSQQIAEDEVLQAESSKSPATRGLRIAVGLMAACVLVFVVGRLALRDDAQPTSTENSPAAVNAEGDQNPASKEAQSATEAKAGASETTMAGEAPAGEKTGDTAALTKGNDANAGSAATAEMAKTEASPNKTEAQQEAAATSETSAATAAIGSEQDVAEQAENAPAKPTTKVEPTGANAAVLVLSEPIEIQVTADGQRIYSGRHEAGKVEIKFNRRAEIFVQDGSKAKLKYSGWDHGALGQAGRKRRIVLNAEAFNGGRP
jgi:cytoskeletal protein RodZ